ncbi:MAG: hypothetical protein HC845_07145 [Akkermansiaceae bacterium]|nr:hypothetical protein [Akkermansiaceae bacterium]
MRGSPLIRSIILAFALVATGFGLMRVTAAKQRTLPVKSPDPVASKTTEKSASFELTLSAPAAEIEIDTGKILRPSVSSSLITGKISLDSGNPRIALKVRWKNPPTSGEHRFAKSESNQQEQAHSVTSSIPQETSMTSSSSP